MLGGHCTYGGFRLSWLLQVNTAALRGCWRVPLLVFGWSVSFNLALSLGLLGFKENALEAKMAKCIVCGVKVSWGDYPNDTCFDCREKNRDGEALQRRTMLLGINAIRLTTETAPNLNITKRIEIVTAECAFGMNIFKDLFAGVRDIVGGRSEAVQKTMRDSRRTALYELKKEAYEVGANAVVGVDIDYVELSKAGSMVMLVASGTAVRIEG
jgi:uncharacterized protein YbjQ (UPF0145 family)